MGEGVGGVLFEKQAVALLMIDIQRALFERNVPIYNMDALLNNFESVVRWFQAADLPVIFIQHSNQSLLIKGTHEWELHPRMQPLLGEHLIHKLHGSAFIDTDLHTTLQELQIDAVVIMGLVTHGCVRASALDALKHGYAVYLVEDGHSSYSTKAKKLIAKWNDALERKGAVLLKAADLCMPGS